MRGLPFSAGKDDIMEFFKDFTISEESIHITFNFDGRPTGEAFVEFSNPEDAKSALAKDRMTLGSRYIELFPSSNEELGDAIAKGRWFFIYLLLLLLVCYVSSTHYQKKFTPKWKK